MLACLALAAACAGGPADKTVGPGGVAFAGDAASTTEQGLVVHPSSVSLAPGGQQVFRSYLRLADGDSLRVQKGTGLVYTATGGTLEAGVYTAGPVPGSYQVTATFGGATARAAISIVTGFPVVPGADSTPPPPPSGAASCLVQTGPLVILAGSQPRHDSRDTMVPDTRVDARQASWTGTLQWPVTAGRQGARGLCWSGGMIQGTWSAGASWSTFHNTGALLVYSPNATVEDVKILNYGDAIRIQDYTNNWTLRRLYVQQAHDDCVENDRQYSGRIEDALFEGCYVFLSERPGSKTLVRDGRNDLVTISNSLVWLKPMPSVYRGPTPGTGPLFKWDKSGSGTKLAITNTIFRVDQAPNHGDLKLPAGLGSCANNTIVWLGKGAYPAKLPACFRVTTDKVVWDRAVADWKARHPKLAP